MPATLAFQAGVAVQHVEEIADSCVRWGGGFGDVEVVGLDCAAAVDPVGEFDQPFAAVWIRGGFVCDR